MGRTLRDDLRRGDLRRTLRKDFRELKELFLDDHRKERLAGMGRVERWLYTTGWLFKALFFRLTPARRLLFVISVLLLVSSFSVNLNERDDSVSVRTNVAAGLILIFILALELKDKLVAQSELEAGRLIQAALQPDRTPSVEGWSCWLFTMAANEVGGDLVDYQKVDGGRHHFSLADVAGKGVRAALVTTRLQATIRALAPEHRTLGELVAKINSHMFQMTTRNMFASLVVFEIASESGDVRLINAGHLPPVVLRKSGAVEMEKGDPAVGIFAQTEFHERLFRLGRGESLVVYSDGIPDAKNDRGEFFGALRFQGILSRMNGAGPEELGGCIKDAVLSFIGEERLYDDVSLVIVRREAE